MKWRTEKDLTPLCIHCKKNRVERKTALYCSPECYSKSGHRSYVGKINGSKAYRLYWKKYDEIFTKKYGHLDRVTQIRILIGLGMKRAYRKTYNQKFSRIKQEI